MVLEQLKQVSSEDVQSMDHRELVEIWKSNNQPMLDYILSKEIPYFGVRGTNTDKLNATLDRRASSLLFWATFYDKKQEELRLFQFYASMGYISCFAHQDDEMGNIIVCNFERVKSKSEDSHNCSIPRKRLKGTGDFEYYFTFEDKKTVEMLNLLKDSKYRLWETQHGFFEDRYLGTIQPSILRRVVDDYAKVQAIRRLDYQYDLARVFDLIK